ncbi:hypothetical protein TcCL_Unassigned00659 [Trypanosoma cruzi]|nr:hypothetical protein TcCL_Unassigned00659 [Trypanosoma cruzi]
MYWHTSSSRTPNLTALFAHIIGIVDITSLPVIGMLSACCTQIITHDMSRDNSSQPLKYAARHSVNCCTVLVVVWCPPAVFIRSPNSVTGIFTKKKKTSTSGKFVAHGL